MLRAPERGGRQLFVHARLEHDVLRLQIRRRLLQGLVVATERRTAVTADEARGVLAHQGIALALQHGQLHQRLHATHEGAPLIERVFVVQRHGFQGAADVFGQWGVHRFCLRVSGSPLGRFVGKRHGG
ncbi:hypothetical protein D9M69_652980 [compost metagenome]